MYMLLQRIDDESSGIKGTWYMREPSFVWTEDVRHAMKLSKKMAAYWLEDAKRVYPNYTHELVDTREYSQRLKQQLYGNEKLLSTECR